MATWQRTVCGGRLLAQFIPFGFGGDRQWDHSPLILVRGMTSPSGHKSCGRPSGLWILLPCWLSCLLCKKYCRHYTVKIRSHACVRVCLCLCTRARACVCFFSVCLCLSVYLPVHLSTCLSICLSVNHSAWLSARLGVSVSVCVHLQVRMFHCIQKQLCATLSQILLNYRPHPFVPLRNLNFRNKRFSSH